MSDEFFATVSCHYHLVAYCPSSGEQGMRWVWLPLVSSLAMVLTAWALS